MRKQEELFSKKHNRLLSIAGWTRYLAWAVLIIYIFMALGTYVREQNFFIYYRSTSFALQGYTDFINLLKSVPSYGFGILIEIIGVILNGIMYFLILKGISLGLNMIVETDINYREDRETQDEQ